MSRGVLVFTAEAGAVRQAFMPQRCCGGECLRLLQITMLPFLRVGLHFQKCFPCVKKNPLLLSRHSRHINDGISQKLKKKKRLKGLLVKLIFSIVAVRRVVFLRGHNKPQSSPFIPTVKLASSPPEITRISVSAFADLNKSRQGHLIGVG